MKSPKRKCASQRTRRNNEQTTLKHSDTTAISFRKPSREAGGGADNKASWRDHTKPHPAALVFHRRTTPEQLRDLAASIKSGLKVPIQVRTVAGESESYVIDGISRLDAMEQILGWEIVDDKGNWKGALASPPGTRPMVDHREGYSHEQIAAEVIAYNAKRRHQTKQELVEDIDDALRAIENITDRVKMIRSVESKRPVRVAGGKFAGSTKGHTGRVVEEAKKVGVSESTAKRALAIQKGEGNRPERSSPKRRTQRPSVDKMSSAQRRRWDKTSKEHIQSKFLGMLERNWAVTQYGKVYSHTLPFMIGSDAVSVTYADGHTKKIADMWKQDMWKREAHK
jgi:hypothetical protein